MKKQKSPFRGFSVEEVLWAEANFYVIEINNDMFNKDGKYAFSKKRTIHFYNKILSELTFLFENGTANERRDALKGLQTLRVLPLRIN